MEAGASSWGFGFIRRRFPTVASSHMFMSARLKIGRASEFINEVKKVLDEDRPFRYVLKTDVKEGTRIIGPQIDEAVVHRVSLICGDAIHNLRSAIDHAYGEVVRAHFPTASPKQIRDIQFPFCKTAAELKDVCRRRHADKVSSEFVTALMDLKPHAEAGGNQLLGFIHYSDVPDKHTNLIPTGRYIDIPIADLRRIVPDFPEGSVGRLKIANSRGYDVRWEGPVFSLNDWVLNRTPPNGIFEKDIPVTVNVTFDGQIDGQSMLIVPTLHHFVDVTNEVLKVLGRFA